MSSIRRKHEERRNKILANSKSRLEKIQALRELELADDYGGDDTKANDRTFLAKEPENKKQSGAISDNSREVIDVENENKKVDRRDKQRRKSSVSENDKLEGNERVNNEETEQDCGKVLVKSVSVEETHTKSLTKRQRRKLRKSSIDDYIMMHDVEPSAENTNVDENDVIHRGGIDRSDVAVFENGNEDPKPCGIRSLGENEPEGLSVSTIATKSRHRSGSDARGRSKTSMADQNEDSLIFGMRFPRARYYPYIFYAVFIRLLMFFEYGWIFKDNLILSFVPLFLLRYRLHRPPSFIVSTFYVVTQFLGISQGMVELGLYIYYLIIDVISSFSVFLVSFLFSHIVVVYITTGNLKAVTPDPTDRFD